MSTDNTKLAVRRTSAVRDRERVRHVDQLSDETRAGLRTLLRGRRRPVEGLEPGEVVKAATYLRVVSVRRQDSTVLAKRNRATADTTALVPV